MNSAPVRRAVTLFAITLVAIPAIPQPAQARTRTCGLSKGHKICVTLPGRNLKGVVNVRVRNRPNGGMLYVSWVPKGGPPQRLKTTFGRDPVTRNYSFRWPTQKYLDARGVLQIRALSPRAKPVKLPVRLSNGNLTTIQRSPEDWEAYLPGPWTQPTDPVIPAVGDGPDGRPVANRVAATIAASDPPLFLFLGDIYEDGTHTELLNHHGVSAMDSTSPTLWGTFADRTQPTLGNHEEENVTHWRDYWHYRPTFTKFTFGGVLFLNLNSSGNFSPGTPQYQLAEEAITDPAAPDCIVGMWHIPTLSGSTVRPAKLPMWSLLANNGGDLVLNGHAHYMAEYVPLDANLNPGPTAHMVELISGAGGHNPSPAKSDPRLAFAKGKTAGILYLTPNGAANGGTATSITWQWRNLRGEVLRSSSVAC